MHEATQKQRKKENNKKGIKHTGRVRYLKIPWKKALSQIWSTKLFPFVDCSLVQCTKLGITKIKKEI